MHTVTMKKSVVKNINRMPERIQMKLKSLIDDLETDGPIRHDWPNYSKLSPNSYHCHLSHKWVACWRKEKNSIIIEVYYAGSRENAPY